MTKVRKTPAPKLTTIADVESEIERKSFLSRFVFPVVMNALSHFFKKARQYLAIPVEPIIATAIGECSSSDLDRLQTPTQTYARTDTD